MCPPVWGQQEGEIYVCVHALSEAECLPLQSKYCLITPSDPSNEKWNSGFPAGLWARLS